MTTLLSLIMDSVNRAPHVAASRVLISVSHHFGVVSSSQSQPPASIAGMLLNRIQPRRRFIARLEQDHLLLAPCLFAVEHQPRSAAQLQALGSLGDHALGNSALHFVRAHFKKYTADAPLFGKHVGRYFWPTHAAGNAAQGEVVKDYKVKPR